MVERKDLSVLEESIGYKFKNIELLKKALTHTSYAYENKVESNEKLEFLGDSILEFLSSKHIYNNYPNLKEGEMTKVRATVVCEESLYKIADKHNFSDFLYVGKSERMHQGNRKVAIMADSEEAVIASMYFTSISDPLSSAIISLLRGLVLLLLFTFLFPYLWGMDGVWAVSPTTEVLTAIVAFSLIRRENNKG